MSLLSYELPENCDGTALCSINMQDVNKFVVGTSSSSVPNWIKILNFIELEGKVIEEGEVNTANKEITSLCSSQNKPNLIAGLCNDYEFNSYILLLNLIEENQSLQIQPPQFFPLLNNKNVTNNIIFHSKDFSSLLTSDHCGIYEYYIEKNEVQKRYENKDEIIKKIKQDPLSDDFLYVAQGKDLLLIDKRTWKVSSCISNAHLSFVNDIDCNPNKKYNIASGGNDCSLKFWDIRNVTEPLLIMLDESMWIKCVRYNNSYDQLLITGSNGCCLKLWKALSASSLTLLKQDLELALNEGEEEKDNLINTILHEDSITGVEWSFSDPWIYAGISYNGNISFNQVPHEEKYKILL